MELKLTHRAEKVLKRAIDNAKHNMNSTVEVEHLIKAILEDTSVINTMMPDDEVLALNRSVSSSISSFGKIQSGAEPQMSHELVNLLNSASKKTTEYISVPLLISLILEIPRISKLFKKPDEYKKRINEILQSKPMDNLNADDPENKMSKFAVEMVSLARQNKFDPVIGRDDEIRQILEILAKKTKSNAIMVGKPGVGKTAIVNGIAQKIANGEAKVLEGYKIYNVDIGAMVAGSSLRGEFEERLKGLVKEAENDKKIILFIDEIHIILGAGNTSGSLDAANILKPGLADGSLKVIGATTHDEYRKYVTKDPAFERRFTKVNVKEPTVDDTITILRGLRERMEVHHGVKISDRALVYASMMGKRYIPNRRLPDLAIDLVDTACASEIISLNSEPIEIQNLKSKIWSLELEKTCVEVDLKRDPTVEPALRLVEKRIEEVYAELKPIEEKYNAEKRDLIKARELKKKLEDARNRMEQAKREGDKYAVRDIQTNIIPVYERELHEYSRKVQVIEPNHIAEIISRSTGIPVSRLTVKDNDKLLCMAEKIKEKIFGQNSAVDTVVNSILASRVGLNRDNKPIGSFLFLGPTGVGKTELSKAICKELNDSCDNMVVLDMSDYVSEMSINKLIGAPAGYVGCEEGGTLTEPIKEMPYNVVLLDEVDLAHQSCLNVLYQLLDEGRVTDGRGVKVNFKNTVLIMTSNLGQQFITSSGIDKKSIENLVISRFGQPLINRIDNIVIFNHLERDALVNIFKQDIKELNLKLMDKKVRFTVSQDVIDVAVRQAMDSQYGARILKRFAKDNFVNTLTRFILMREDDSQLNITCHLNTENIDGTVIGDFTYVFQ